MASSRARVLRTRPTRRRRTTKRKNLTPRNRRRTKQKSKLPYHTVGTSKILMLSMSRISPQETLWDAPPPHPPPHHPHPLPGRGGGGGHGASSSSPSRIAAAVAHGGICQALRLAQAAATAAAGRGGQLSNFVFPCSLGQIIPNRFSSCELFECVHCQIVFLFAVSSL